jgi:hypothetical protein
MDPAYIPGLTPPPPAEGSVADAETTPDIPPKAPKFVKAAPVEVEAPDLARPAGDAADAEDAQAAEADAEAEDEARDDDLPVFEAADRRGAIIADRDGVTFRLDDQEAEFGWDEIGAVEIDTPRFGRRLSVTVYTSTRRWFQADIEAPSRGVLKQWTAELDAVLDARFEEEADAEADIEAEVEPEAESEPEADTESEPNAVTGVKAGAKAEPTA